MKKTFMLLATMVALVFSSCSDKNSAQKDFVDNLYKEAIAGDMMGVDINKDLLMKYGSKSLVASIKELDEVDEGGGLTYMLYYGRIIEVMYNYCSDGSNILQNQTYTIDKCEGNTVEVTYAYDVYEVDFGDEEAAPTLKESVKAPHKLILVEEDGQLKIDEIFTKSGWNDEMVSLKEAIDEGKNMVGAMMSGAE